MRDFSKYQGVIPAFYACYDDLGAVSATKVRELTRYLIGKGVKGLYVGGSSGECIYQSVEERKLVLENVMAEARGKVTIIAHVACNNTSDSQALAAHAESLGVDAIAAIPPIYFHLPDYAIAKYWNDIRPQHGFRHLQHPPAGRCGPERLPAQGDAEESPGHRRKELLHACPGHSDVEGRGLHRIQRPR